ncbi:hypothetical protein BDY19DRAFT_908118 [Irpex rosettiformis]|uniref:Uncharacterized protein n=1 Tax=Irpex rosettiformis TaxID=378272 RepID=A0ACB8TXV5_9APHY|nr:hypothetical protein BDY19DRAFT_908118 [Irpex rosettiformis]
MFVVSVGIRVGVNSLFIYYPDNCWRLSVTYTRRTLLFVVPTSFIVFASVSHADIRRVCRCTRQLLVNVTDCCLNITLLPWCFSLRRLFDVLGRCARCTIIMAKKKSTASSSKRKSPSNAAPRPKPATDLVAPDSVYPSFEDRVDPSVLKDLTPFPIVGRSPKVPPIFEYHGPHPYHRVKSSESRTFVYLLDPSPEGKDYAYALSESLGVPGGPTEALRGDLELLPGDALLGRPINKGGDPSFDCLQVLVGIVLDENLTPHIVNLLEHQERWTHGDIADAIRELMVARNDVLGSRADRVSTGKTAFELDPRAKPMKNGPQCFPLNNMVQQARQVEGPPAALKTVYNTPDTHQLRTHKFVMAVTKINTIGWDLQGPPSSLSAAEAYHDMINCPNLGHRRNFSSASQQMNIADAQRPTDSANSAFVEQQGHFGDAHIDFRDASNGWSCGNSLGDTPESPGFALPAPSVVHRPLTTRRYPPIGPKSVQFSWLGKASVCYQLSCVWHSVGGSQTFLRLYSVPENTPLPSLEMTGAPVLGGTPPFYTNHATIAQDGWVTMDRPSLLNFIMRGTLQYTRWILRQLPPECGIQVDANQFIRSVSYLEEDTETRVNPDDWDLAPDSDVQCPFGERHKAIQDAFLKTENDRLIAGIPIMTDNPYAEWDVTAMNYGHRTSKPGSVKRKQCPHQPAGGNKSKRPRTAAIMKAHTTWLVPDVLNDDNEVVGEGLRASGSGSGNGGDAEVVGTGVHVREEDGDDSDGEDASDNQDIEARGVENDDEDEDDEDRDSETDNNEGKNKGDYDDEVGEEDEEGEGDHDEVDGAADSVVEFGEIRELRDADTEHGGREESRSEEMQLAFTQAPVKDVYVLAPPLPAHARRWKETHGLDNCHEPSNSTGSTDAVRDVDRFPDFIRLTCITGEGVIDSILGSNIEERIHSVEGVVPAVISSEFLRHTLQNFDELDAKLTNALVPGCLDKDSLALCATSTRGIKEFCDGTDHWLSLYRQRVMLTKTILDRSVRHIIDNTCPDIVSAVLDGTFVSCDDWLSVLTEKVTTLVKCGMPVKAKSIQFFSPDKIAPKEFVEKASAAVRRKHLHPRKLKPLVLSYIRQILFVWFTSETPFTSQIQGALVRALVTHLGSGVLLLPDVWALYSNIPPWILAKECPRPYHANTSPDAIFRPEYLEPFVSRMVSDARISDARASMQQLQDAYVRLHERTNVHVQGSIEEATKAGNLRRLLKSMSAGTVIPQGPSESLSVFDGPPNTVPPLPSPISASTSVSPDASGAFAGPTPQVRRVIQFLQDSFVAVQALNDVGAYSSDLTDSQKFIMKRPDFYLPLRELAPSRAIMTAGLDRDFASTRAGFFSLQVFRHIHFNTEAFRLCPPDLRQVQFHTLADYKQYVAALQAHFPGRGDFFFCNKRALGSPVNDRTIERADDYWDVAMSPDYTWPPPRRFAAAYQSMTEFKKCLAPEHKHLWSGVGSLSMFLLLLDMHFVGLVDEPTVEDIAGIVASLQKGATFGLRSLGYLNASFNNIECRNQFTQFHDDVSQALSEEQAKQYGWSPIVCEHTLCKFSRLFKEGFYH